MKKPLPVSEELLNAFVDNEIDAEEQESILILEATNPDVKQAICELRRLKSQVRAARPAEVDDSKISIHSSHKSLNWYAAASILVAVTLVVAIFNPVRNDGVFTYSQNSTYSDTALLLTAAGKEKDLNLVLQLSSADVNSMSHTLDLIRSILTVAEHYNNRIDIEVIASGPGLKLLLSGNPEYANRIQKLSNQYSNLVFLACQKTMQRMSKHTPSKLELLKEVKLVSSGPLWAKQRRQQGWAYVRI